MKQIPRWLLIMKMLLAKQYNDYRIMCLITKCVKLQNLERDSIEGSQETVVSSFKKSNMVMVCLQVLELSKSQVQRIGTLLNTYLPKSLSTLFNLTCFMADAADQLVSSKFICIPSILAAATSNILPGRIK